MGMSDDAVKVFCDMTDGGKTCVFPDVHASKMPNIPWRKSGDGWYSNLRGGFRISYDSVGKVQVIQWCTLWCQLEDMFQLIGTPQGVELVLFQKIVKPLCFEKYRVEYKS